MTVYHKQNALCAIKTEFLYSSQSQSHQATHCPGRMKLAEEGSLQYQTTEEKLLWQNKADSLYIKAHITIEKIQVIELKEASLELPCGT